MKTNRLVAVVGLPGAGKSVAVEEFVYKGYQLVYFGGLTFKKLKEEKLAVNEKNERMMREKLRASHGMAAYALLNIPTIEEALTKGKVVIDGLYSWEEYLVLKDKFPLLEILAVWAPPKLRYQRLATRKVRPLQQAEVESRERSQIEKLNQGGPIAVADWLVANTGTKNELKRALEEVLYGKK